MQYKHIAMLIFLLLAYNIYTDNYMDEIAYIEGEQGNDWFGVEVESLDFNGDGKDDLAVSAPGYNVDETTEGKFYLYFGKEENFADSADIIMCAETDEESYSLRTFSRMECVGDVNGDGCDDLGYIHNVDYPDDVSSIYTLKILFGGTVTDTIPDLLYEFSSENYVSNYRVSELGDINGDDFDDIGFCIDLHGYNPKITEYFICWGGSYTLEHFAFFETNNYSATIEGIGDINNDSFDDFSIFSKASGIIHSYIYFGATEIDTIPDLDMNEYLGNPEWPNSGLLSCGDWSGDNIDDFMTLTPWDNGIAIWNGGNTFFNPSIDCFIEFWDYSIKNDYGDLNGDGKLDLCLGYQGASNAYIYLGHQNGTNDLVLSESSLFNFGWDIAIGNFNCDEYDDVAVGTYVNMTHWPGRVWVYGGNGELTEADPDVNADISNIPASEVKFEAYPNPFNPIVTFSYKLPDVNVDSVKINIYNIKGQKVASLYNIYKVNNTKNKITWNAINQASGAYFCQLVINNEVVQTIKIVLLK